VSEDKEPVFEIFVDQYDVTLDGSMSGPRGSPTYYEPDVVRRFIPGLTHYLIDGKEVSQEEFERRLKAEKEKYD